MIEVAPLRALGNTGGRAQPPHRVAWVRVGASVFVVVVVVVVLHFGGALCRCIHAIEVASCHAVVQPVRSKQTGQERLPRFAPLHGCK